MEFQALKEKLRTAKLHPVHVEGSPVDDDAKGHRFIGSLEEYSEAVRAMGVPVVLIWTETLEEWHFFHAPEDEDETSDNETEQVDLCAITPALRAFKTHLGSIAIYKLSAALTTGGLDFIINEPWWVDFLKLRATATDQVDEDQEASEAKSRADQQAKDRDALNALGALIRDPDFVRLPTQIAMIAYATEKIPELETIDEFALRAEVQNLHAKIKAKGLGRKR